MYAIKTGNNKRKGAIRTKDLSAPHLRALKDGLVVLNLKPACVQDRRRKWMEGKFRNIAFLILIAFCFVAGVAGSANSAVTVYTDKALWSAAVSDTYQTEAFDDSVLNPGVSVVSTVGVVSGGVWSDRLVPGVNTTTFSFSPDITAFGGDWDLNPGGMGTGILVTLKNGTDIVIPDQILANGFWGLVSDVPFVSVYLISGSNPGSAETFYMDNMVYKNTKLDPTVTVSGGPFTYDGTAHAATVSVTGDGGITVAGSSTVTYTGTGYGPTTDAPTNAGTYSVSVSFTSSDAGYNDATGSGSIIINPATPTVTVSGGPFTYDTAAHSATVSVTGVADVTVSGSSTVTYTGTGYGPTTDAPINAGTYSVSVSFTSGDTNYGDATGSGSITINKATCTVTAENKSVQYSDPEPLYTFIYSNFQGSETGSVIDTHPICSVSGEHINVGTYTIACSGGVDNNYNFAYVSGTLQITPEDAVVDLPEANAASVKVAAPGGKSGVFTLDAYVNELLPDAGCPEGFECAGDISTAAVTMTLVPVGPGTSTVSSTCSRVEVVGTGYDSQLHVTCSFNNVAVNTYQVIATAGGNYTGSDESVVVIYDPSLGFTTGGGWFYWPGTAHDEYPGDRTNFGYTMKYNSKRTNIQGGIIMIHHLEDGTILRVKSNSLGGLSLGSDSNVPMGWASFTGKANNNIVDGNYTFTVYVEDRNEPGTGTDRFWVHFKEAALESVSLPNTAIDNAVNLNGGNIVVPHSSGGKRR